MTTNESEAAAASRLMDMVIAHWAGELLLQAAEMSLADKFTGEEPRSAAELAAGYGMLVRPMRRFLRSLTGLGLLASAGSGISSTTGTMERTRRFCRTCARR